MTDHIAGSAGRLREHLDEVQRLVIDLEPPALLHCLREIARSGQRSREDDGGPLSDLMRRLWLIRSAAYSAEGIKRWRKRLQSATSTESSKLLWSGL